MRLRVRTFVLSLVLLLGSGLSVVGDVLYSVTDLGPGSASGINNAGQVTGTSGGAAGTASGLHAVFWANGQMLDLGSLGGSDGHGFVYSDGQVLDLNELIDPALGVTLSDSEGINDKGQPWRVRSTVTPMFLTCPQTRHANCAHRRIGRTPRLCDITTSGANLPSSHSLLVVTYSIRYRRAACIAAPCILAA